MNAEQRAYLVYKLVQMADAGPLGFDAETIREAARALEQPRAVAEGMGRIGELIRTQDNRVTEAPIFIVQQKAGRNRWEFVTACFTEQGCKDYIAKDGHNLREPRIFASGSHRNAEWRAVRNWLLAAAPTPDKENGK